MEEVEALDRQAELLSRYLVGEAPDEIAADLYVRAVAREPSASDRDRQLVAFAFRHPRLLGVLDGGLAIIKPSAELRRRIYSMSAILEARPQHSAAFLPRARSRWYLLILGMYGLRGGLRAVAGIIILKGLRYR